MLWLVQCFSAHKVYYFNSCFWNPINGKTENPNPNEQYLLRKKYNFTTNPKRKFAVDCVYSTEQLAYPTSDGGVCLAKQGTEGAKNMDCATGYGSATMVTASFGFFASSKAIKKYIDKKRKSC